MTFEAYDWDFEKEYIFRRLNKCELWLSKVAFLGHMFDNGKESLLLMLLEIRKNKHE
jgi:hypothetical protein